MRSHLFLLLAGAPLLAGCPNTDTAVFVSPSADAPAVAVSENPLGTSVSGSFTLSLHLGARASGPSQVTLGQFEIKDAAMKEAIVTPLSLSPADGMTQFPVTVQPDSDVDVALTFDTGQKLLAADLGAKLCDAAGVVIGGTIQDSLQDTATPVDSAVVHASGCQ